MAAGYRHDPEGEDRFAKRLARLQAQLDEVRGRSGVKNAVLRGDVLTFQSAAGDLTALVGEFAGNRFDYPDWVADTIRGLQLTKAGDTDPFAHIAHAVGADRIDVVLGFGDTALGVMYVQPGEFWVDGFGDSQLYVDSTGRVFINSAAATDIVVTAGDMAQINADGEVELNGATIDLNSTGDTSLDAGAALNLNANSGDVNANASGNVDLNPGSDLRFFIGSHATPANLSINGSVVRQVSSAAEYKDDIEDIVVDKEIFLSMKGKTYVDARDKAEAVERGEPAVRYPGFIADEWAEHEATRQFVQFDDAGNPLSFFYDRVSVAQHEIIRDQEHRITALEAEVVELKATVAELVKKPKGK